MKTDADVAIALRQGLSLQWNKHEGEFRRLAERDDRVGMEAREALEWVRKMREGTQRRRTAPEAKKQQPTQPEKPKQ